MKIKDLFENWNLTGLKIKASFLEMEWKPSDPDKAAAWDLYVELVTRITTQPLADEHGVEQTALASTHALFDLTRQTLKKHGHGCEQFAKIAIVVLNQVVRPFTAKWHRKSQNGAFASPDDCQQFRQELQVLQTQLRNYTRLLAELAGVEDLTEIEAEDL